MSTEYRTYKVIFYYYQKEKVKTIDKAEQMF